jgi:hypothetical protein
VIVNMHGRTTIKIFFVCCSCLEINTIDLIMRALLQLRNAIVQRIFFEKEIGASGT